MAGDGARPGMLAEYLRGSVGGAIVDDDDLADAVRGQRRLAHALQDLRECAEFVIDGNEDRNLHGFRSTAKSDWPKGGRSIPSMRDRMGTTHVSKIAICPSDWASRRKMWEFSHQPKKP